MTEREPYPSEKQDRFIVRMPDGMRDRIKAAAEQNNRSMNAEIVARLDAAFSKPSFDMEKLTVPAGQFNRDNLRQMERQFRKMAESLRTVLESYGSKSPETDDSSAQKD